MMRFLPVREVLLVLLAVVFEPEFESVLWALESEGYIGSFDEIWVPLSADEIASVILPL